MKLSLAGLKVHLAHCAASPSHGRHFGLTFTATGLPGIAAVPTLHQEGFMARARNPIQANAQRRPVPALLSLVCRVTNFR